MIDDQSIEYPDDVTAKLELVFSKGFLSPGGPEEVTKIVEDIDLRGKKVLDVGVGLAGPACALVRDHGAAHVTGIDIEQPLLTRAEETVAAYGLQEQVSLKLVTPGPLPFDDESFDIVFSKDAIIHIPDKLAIFKEIYRVLRPGGWTVMSDWHCGSEPFSEEMIDWVENSGLSFALTQLQTDGGLLSEAGFVDALTLDRNSWFAAHCQRSLERMRGPDHGQLVAELGQEDADILISAAIRRATIASQGQLRPGHIRGRKPN
jgi:SAM-dependent methyltransferase